MKFKTNAIIALVFAGLLAFVYLYEIKGGEKRQAAEEKAGIVLDFSAGEAVKLVLERGDTLIAVEKRDSWVLTDPIESATDEDAVERYIDDLARARRERVVEDSASATDYPEAAAKYRLTAPRLKVFLAIESEELDTLFFGAESPTGSYVFARRSGPNPEIFTMRTFHFNSLDKGVFDLRDRRVLPFEKKEVQEVRLARPEGRIVLERRGKDDWYMRVPAQVPVDEDAVDEILNRLNNAIVDTFVAERPDEDVKARHGLAGLVNLEVSLLLGAEHTEKRLRLGAAHDGYRTYAMDLSRPPIFLVDTTLVRPLQRQAKDLRDRKPLEFGRDAVTRIEISGAESLVAEKDTTGLWMLVEPDVRPTRSWKFNNLMTDLEEVEVEKFVEDQVEDMGPYGLDSPQLRVKLIGEEGEELLEVHLGNREDEMIYLTKVGVPSVYIVSEYVLQDLALQVDDVIELPELDEGGEADEPGEADETEEADGP